MDYRILGPLEVRDGDGELPLGSPRLRALLGLLLLHRNEPVSSERLIDELWAGAPPATANKALQNGVSQLRRVLARDVLRTVPRGYVLRVGEDELDADRFERALDAARDARRPAESAAATAAGGARAVARAGAARARGCDRGPAGARPAGGAAAPRRSRSASRRT